MFHSSELTTANDSVLNALALLGAYQTGTERAFISLFDSNHQYIIAEAAPSIPITPRLPSDNCPLPLSLCGTAIPRSQGTCDHVLYLPESQDSHDDVELPLSFVPNLATDPRFSSRPYCQFGDSGQFYAGVPIRTRKGINIGAYCVMNPMVPDGWDAQCTRRLRDISNAIMEHLECNRSKQAYWRSERMNRGLTSFMEGRATLAEWQSQEELETFMANGKLEGSLNSEQRHTESRE